MRLVIDLQGAQGASRERGIGRYSRELALAMASAARDHDVIIALSGAFPDAAEDLTASFARILPRAQIRMWHPPRAAGRLYDSAWHNFAETLRVQFLRSLQPDLVHVASLFEGLGDNVISLSPPQLQRLPMVATCYDLIPLIRHTEYFGAAGPMSPGVRWYYRALQEMTLCEGLLAISESSRGEAIRHLGYPAHRVFDVQAGISADFRPARLSVEERVAFLRRFGLRESFILFLGAGDVRKNEAGLIAAYARLPEQLRERHQLVIVGRMEPGKLRLTAERLRIPVEHFVIIPFVAEADLNALYSTCALFVFPSLHEGFGLPAAEAMACGAPTIASNTTSLPEVLGREDATFDPNDPEAIAGCMRRVLENPGFRDELAAHGPRQAARFTWQSSAARAWDALEQIHAGTTDRAAKPAAVALLPKRPKLAFVSPLPPDRGEAVEHSRALLPHLARHYDITLVTETEVDDLRLDAAFPRLAASELLHRAGEFARVLYQIGNTPLHHFQLEVLLPHCPGVVVLREPSLSEYFDWLARDRARPDDFRAVLLRSHGYAALRFEAEHGREAAVAHYPCCLPVLADAIGVIQPARRDVHVLQRHFGVAAADGVMVVPSSPGDRGRPDRASARASLGLPGDEFVVCCISDSRHVAMLGRAWCRTGPGGRMVVLGEPSGAGIAGVRYTGRLGRAHYEQWLAAADLGVDLDGGADGNALDGISDAMAAGLPMILARAGLPEDVAVRLADRTDADRLAAVIASLRDDAPRRAALAAAGRAFVQRELPPETVALRYRDAIEQAYARPLAATVARCMEREAAEAGAIAGALREASRAIGRSFPATWRAGGLRRLLVDVSELARRDQGSGIQRVVREISRRVLEFPPAGYRADAVRAHDGQLRLAYAAALRMLGRATLELPETPVDAGLGDTLLCVDVNAELTAAEFAELRRLRLEGVRIVLVVYDLLPMTHPELFPPVPIELVRHWYIRMLGMVDGVVCISRAVADELVAWLDEDRSRRAMPLPIGYFHLGADFRAEGPAEAASVAEQAALDSAARRPTVIMTGTVEVRKGHFQALAAFETLWQRNEDIGLVIVGREGWHMEAFGARVRESVGLGDRLHWLSECSDAALRRLYRGGAGLLMASKHEGFGLPIIEAAQAGLSVLLRDLPVFREVAGDHARYFTGDEAADLAVALDEWRKADFTPGSDGIRPLSWDDSFEQLCRVVFEGGWYTVWEPAKPQRPAR